MANVSTDGGLKVLNYLYNPATTPARPAAWGIGLSDGAPTSVSASEIGTATAVRQTVSFAAATANSVSNNLAATFSFASAATVTGLQVWDTASSVNGMMLNYGNLATVRTMGAGDSLVFATGSLVITLG